MVPSHKVRCAIAVLSHLNTLRVRPMDSLTPPIHCLECRSPACFDAATCRHCGTPVWTQQVMQRIASEQPSRIPGGLTLISSGIGIVLLLILVWLGLLGAGFESHMRAIGTMKEHDASEKHESN